MAAAEYGGVPETGRERQLSTVLIRADGLRRLDSFLGHRSARPARPLGVGSAVPQPCALTSPACADPRRPSLLRKAHLSANSWDRRAHGLLFLLLLTMVVRKS